MTYVPYSPEVGAKYTLTGPDGTIAVFNDPTDPNYVGMLTDVTGLDSATVRESGDDMVGGDGGWHGDFYYGRRPITLSGTVFGHSSGDVRTLRLDRLRRASNAMRGDATLGWVNTGVNVVPMQTWVRRQQPLRISGAWTKDFQVLLVSEFTPLFSQAQTQVSVKNQYQNARLGPGSNISPGFTGGDWTAIGGTLASSNTLPPDMVSAGYITSGGGNTEAHSAQVTATGGTPVGFWKPDPGTHGGGQNFFGDALNWPLFDTNTDYTFSFEVSGPASVPFKCEVHFYNAALADLGSPVSGATTTTTGPGNWVRAQTTVTQAQMPANTHSFALKMISTTNPSASAVFLFANPQIVNGTGVTLADPRNPNTTFLPQGDFPVYPRFAVWGPIPSTDTFHIQNNGSGDKIQCLPGLTVSRYEYLVIDSLQHRMFKCTTFNERPVDFPTRIEPDANIVEVTNYIDFVNSTWPTVSPEVTNTFQFNYDPTGSTPPDYSGMTVIFNDGWT